MLNEDRIKTMSEIAIFRNDNEKDLSLTENFYEIDYITKHMLVSFVGFTICYGLFVVVLMLYNSQELLGIFDIDEAVSLLKRYVVYYVLGLIIYELFTFIVFKIKYSNAKKTQRLYLAMLKRLSRKQEN